jgi:hypothetical protein
MDAVRAWFQRWSEHARGNPPIQATTPTDFQGQEYLGIYPYAVQQKSQANAERIWIHRSPTKYVVFEEWLNGKEPYERYSHAHSRRTQDGATGGTQQATLTVTANLPRRQPLQLTVDAFASADSQ